MASCTGCRDAGRFVVWIVRAVVILHVARGTFCTGEIEIPVDVALRTLQSGVCAGQRKSHQAVIESRGLPRAGSVASLTGLWKVQRNVVWIRRPAEIRQVASHAIRRRAFEFPSDVASCALQRGVHSSQRKPGVFRVIKFHSKPVVHAVALVARSGKARGHVAGPGGVLIVGCMAGVALGCQSLKLSSRRALVARVALQGGMCAKQREPILVLLNLLYCHLPSLNRVALCTIGSKLPLMNVGVAVGASLTHIGKNWLDVALGASQVLVHAAKRISRLIVIEFRNVADRLPSAEGMAILAGNIQRAMWAARAGRGLPLRGSGNCGGEQQQRHDQIDQSP